MILSHGSWQARTICYCALCLFVISSPGPPSEISKHFIKQILASFWNNLISLLPWLCVWRWSCSWNNWKWWIPTLSEFTATPDLAEWILCIQKTCNIQTPAVLRKQQCWDCKDKNLSASLKNRKWNGWLEMRKKC